MDKQSNFSFLAKALLAATSLAMCFVLGRFVVRAFSGFPVTVSSDSPSSNKVISELDLPFSVRVASHKTYSFSPRYRSHFVRISAIDGIPDSLVNYECTTQSPELFWEQYELDQFDLADPIWNGSKEIFRLRKTIKFGNADVYFSKKTNVLLVVYYRTE